jgi:hypothetical protein
MQFADYSLEWDLMSGCAEDGFFATCEYVSRGSWPCSISYATAEVRQRKLHGDDEGSMHQIVFPIAYFLFDADTGTP